MKEWAWLLKNNFKNATNWRQWSQHCDINWKYKKEKRLELI